MTASSGMPAIFDRLSRFFVCAFAFFIPLWKSAIHVTLIAAFVFFVLKKVTEKRFLAPTPVSKPIAIFLCYAFLSLLWSHHPDLNTRGIVKYLKDFSILFLVTELFQDRGSLKTLIHCLFAGAVVTCLNGFFQYFNFLDLIYSHEFGTRITSTFKNPTVLSTYIVCLLPLPFLFLKKEISMKNNLLYIALTALFFMVFIFSFSRNTFFLFFSSLIFLGLFQARVKFLTKMALGALFIAPLFFIKLPQTLSIVDMFRASPSLNERVFLWGIAKEMISDHPLLGHGINSYTAIRSNYFPPIDRMPTAFPYLHDAHPHNSYLKIWIETGLVGLLLYLSIFFALALFARKVFTAASDRWRFYPYALGLFVFLAASLFDTFLMGALQLRMVFWLLMGIFVVELKLLSQSDASTDSAVPMRDVAPVPVGAPQTSPAPHAPSVPVC